MSEDDPLHRAEHVAAVTRAIFLKITTSVRLQQGDLVVLCLGSSLPFVGAIGVTMEDR